jgi:MFS family permease
VALGMLAQALRALWAPLADISLTFKRWCVLGTIGTALLLFGVTFVPIDARHMGLLSALLFLLGAMACLQNTPVGGLMAYAIQDSAKGRASGAAIFGGMTGTALGGALGIWITSHLSSPRLAAGMLAALCILALPALRFVGEPAREMRKVPIRHQLSMMFADVWSVLKARRAILVALLVLTPVGLGATSNIWPAIAPEWKVSADLLSVLGGLGTTVVLMLGCLAAGWLSDRWDSIAAFLLAGLLVCVAGTALALGPRTPLGFSIWSLAYMFSVGAANAAYLAMIMAVIGRGAAAFKYAVLNSLGNVPTTYMTALNGWVHDRAGVTAMLLIEAGSCLALIVVFAIADRILQTAAASMPGSRAVPEIPT